MQKRFLILFFHFFCPKGLFARACCTCTMKIKGGRRINFIFFVFTPDMLAFIDGFSITKLFSFFFSKIFWWNKSFTNLYLPRWQIQKQASMFPFIECDFKRVNYCQRLKKNWKKKYMLLFYTHGSDWSQLLFIFFCLLYLCVMLAYLT